jgi:hypothetical protein
MAHRRRTQKYASSTLSPTNRSNNFARLEEFGENFLRPKKQPGEAEMLWPFTHGVVGVKCLAQDEDDTRKHNQHQSHPTVQKEPHRCCQTYSMIVGRHTPEKYRCASRTAVRPIAEHQLSTVHRLRPPLRPRQSDPLITSRAGYSSSPEMRSSVTMIRYRTKHTSSPLDGRKSACWVQGRR